MRCRTTQPPGSALTAEHQFSRPFALHAARSASIITIYRLVIFSSTPSRLSFISITRFYGLCGRWFLQPGRLTADWAAGRRKSFHPPVQLFLLMNVLYFVATALNGWNTLATNLDTHISWTGHQEIAKSMVDGQLAARGVTLKEYRPVFDAKSTIQAKSLVILMVPVFAVAVALLSLWSGRYVVEHLVFSVHVHAFILLYLSVSTSLTTVVLGALRYGGIRPTSQAIDEVVSGVWLLILSLYLAVAVRTMYRNGWLLSIAKAGLLCYAWLTMLRLYRFALFLVTFYST